MNTFTSVKHILLFSLLMICHQSFCFSKSDSSCIYENIENVSNSGSNIEANKSSINVSGNLVSNSATCVNNGSISAVASGGSGIIKLYIFTLTNGPTSNGQVYPTTEQYSLSSFQFNDLYPGNYQVTIEDANNINNPVFIQNITVVDETESLNFSISAISPVCPGESSGAITANVSSGVGPYQYQILNGPSGTTTGLFSSANTTYSFDNIPSGNYDIRVYDVCGNFQTRSYVLSDPTLLALNLYSSGAPPRERISCTDALYKVGGSGGTGYGTFTYEVVGGAPFGYSSTNSNGQFTLPISGAPYTFQVTDACGQTATYTHSNPNSYLSWSSEERNCNDWSIQINTNWMVGPYVYTLTNVPAGYTGPMSNNTGLFEGLPYGYVSYTVTDACGLVKSGGTTRSMEPVEINEALTVPRIDTCEEGTGKIQIRYNKGSNGAIEPVVFELTTVPVDFTGDAGPQFGATFDALTPGNYVATLTDACGNVDTHPFEIIDVLTVDVQANVTLSCVNSSSISASVNSNNYPHTAGTRNFRLYNAATNALVQNKNIYGSTVVCTFNNLPAGEYYVQYYSSYYCRYNSDTVVISNYVQPSIPSLNGYSCSGNGLATISGVVEGGIGPYMFSLINNANNQVITTNSDCYFINQNPSLSYSVRIEDSCGNSNSTQVSIVSTGLGLSFQGESCAEIGDRFSLYLRQYKGMTFTWTFPDGSTYVGNDPRSIIGVITNNDFGVYTVHATTNDGCRTQDLTIDFNNCPPPSIDFDGIDDYISAPETFNINNWEELTLQFWVKANSATQNLAGIVGQQGVLEVAKSISLDYSFKGQGNTGSFSKLQWLDDSDTWQHITLVYKNGTIKTYYNGELEHTQFGNGVTTTSTSSSTFNIGGRIKSAFPSNYFHGWIDEVRVFDKALTETQLQQIIYQEIENNNGYVKGSIIPKDVVDFNSGEKLSWSNLKLYYRMGTTFTADDKVIDYSGNENHGTIHNITTWQEETAPMPYVTKQDGNWEDSITWLHGDVWDLASGVKFPDLFTASNIDYAIVKIAHNVYLDYNNLYDVSYVTANEEEGLTQMGLIIDAGKKLTVANDKYIKNLSYLELNGTIDLDNDSQLIQTKNSDLVTSAQGKILRRQEGASSYYWYNYWSSPVGSSGVTNLSDNNTSSNNANNNSFKLNMLKKGNGTNFSFTSANHQINKLSTRWMYTYENGVTYYDWGTVTPTTNINPGVGYIHKGTGVAQQYLFEGKPNNGTIKIGVNDLGGSGSVPGVSKTEYLLGNPYASAIDIHKFLDDNASVLQGSIQLWQQWSGISHTTTEYEGGYAQVNKTGAVRAYQFIGGIGANNGSQDGTRMPTKYVPVGQSFIAEIKNTGSVVFKNSQRVFIKEADADGSYTNGSVFFRTADRSSQESTMQKLRLEFNAIDGQATRRELLLGFSDITTDGYDYGYEAVNTDNNHDDLNLLLEGEYMTMQSYAAITEDKVVPLALKTSGNNSYSIQLSETNNIAEDQEIYLKDNFTDTYYNLRQDAAYVFTSDAGEFNERFEIVFTSERLSIEEVTAENNTVIYYNNNNDLLYVKGLNTSSKVSLINMLGQTVYTQANVSNNTLENGLSIQNLATGIYIVSIKTEDNQTLDKKIIIE